MKRGLSALIGATAVVMVAAGCGSSESSDSASTKSSATSTAVTTTKTRSGKKVYSSSGAIKSNRNTTPKYVAPSDSAPVQKGTVQIAYRNIAIVPDSVKVKVGSTIKWTNYDSVEHNVISQGGPAHFSSKTFGEGGTFEVKVTKAGVIHYECSIHPTTMNGTIEVLS